MNFRVIQWYTGAIAREQIRIIQSRPYMEVVGAVVHHEAKVGKDVGDIAECGPVGITTVGTLEEGLATTVTLGASLSGSGSLGTIATAARIVNAVQDVCDATPGVLTAATAPMPRFRGTPG
jgi:hypothetical protein